MKAIFLDKYYSFISISGKGVKNFLNGHFGLKIKNKYLITDVYPSKGGPDSPCPWYHL